MKRTLLAVPAALMVTAMMAMPASATSASPPGDGDDGTVHVVRPGASIQAAVDEADPGDTISIQAGTYRESVLVTEDDITISGAGSGPGGTLLLPPAEFPDNRCGTNPPAPEPPPYGAGICMFGDWSGPAGPTAHATRFLQGGRVTGIRVDGFAINIATVATDGIRVDHNVSLNGGHYGITHVLSKNGLIEHNTVRGAHHVGVYVGAYNIPDANSVLRDNTVDASGVGFSSYDTQGLTLSRNVMSGSCAGYLAWADGLRVPGGTKLNVTGNLIVNNNQQPTTHGCDAVPGLGFPDNNGSGIILVGTTESSITRNVVIGNRGDLPLSGGIVLVTGRNFGGSLPGDDEESVTIARNVLRDNGPTDLGWDGVGEDVVFADNVCETSRPAELCG
jgi:hypothetical protein